MQALIIKATDETPSITLDPEKNVFEFSGKSLPEDVTTFYSPVLAWLTNYGETPRSNTTVDFKLVYFNTASSKLILDILFLLEKIHESGTSIQIKWHYEEEDEDMKEAGDEYSDLVEVPFQLECIPA
jgi:SiaC family regulatory phosphoprotein